LRTLARLAVRWQMAARMAAMPGGGRVCERDDNGRASLRVRPASAAQ